LTLRPHDVASGWSQGAENMLLCVIEIFKIQGSGEARTKFMTRVALPLQARRKHRKMSQRLWRARAVTRWRQNASCPPRTPLLGEKRSSIFKSVLCSVLSSKINDSTCVRLCFDLCVCLCVCMWRESERESIMLERHIFYQRGRTRNFAARHQNKAHRQSNENKWLAGRQHFTEDREH
jgi:hypothetical protein